MDSMVELIIMALFGAVCSMIATSRGRSGVAWFVLGFFLSCIALVLVLVLPDLKAQEERHRRLTKENRKLKEAMRKDRRVADTRHRDSERRLAVHDRALNVDTEGHIEAGDETAHLSMPSDAAGEVERQPVSTGDPGASSWFYLVGDQQVGPVNQSSLRKLWGDGAVDAATYVWNDSMTDWVRISDLPNLKAGLHD